MRKKKSSMLFRYSAPLKNLLIKKEKKNLSFLLVIMVQLIT